MSRSARSRPRWAPPLWTPESSTTILGAMARVELTRHLYEYFPKLSGVDLQVDAPNVAGVIAELERRLPGFAFYVCDERGRLRQHVNIFVGDEMISDRRSLTDTVESDTRVLIMQALSGG